MLDIWYMNQPHPGNMGDILTPWLLKQDNVVFKKVSRGSNKTLCIGSIIKFAKAGDDIWGSGVLHTNDKINPDAVFHAVRGPLTREIILKNGGACEEVYGDPALLLPRFHTPKVIGKEGMCIVPHYVDYEDAIDSNIGIDVINILNADPIEVVDDIVRHDIVFSSSLHGLIVAHAYNIPAVWLKLSDKLVGDDIKFRDHYAALGIEAKSFEKPCAEAIELAYKQQTAIKMPDLDKLWNCRPWRKTCIL